jgi:type IV secretion system protein VirB5
MKNTEIIKVSPLEQLSEPSVYEIKAELIKFIEDARSVVGDPDFQKKLLNAVYAHIQVGTPAFNTMNQWYAANNPYDRAKTTRVIPHDTNVTAVGGKTFLIEWQEDYKQKDGAIYATKRYRATTIIERGSITKESEVLQNPFGLFVQEIDMGEFRGGK